jgi:hypothetical protein
MNRNARIVLYSIGGLALVAMTVFASMQAMFAKRLSGYWPWERRTAIEYQIPDGYQGWVQLKWGVTGAPPLATSGRHLIVSFNSNGEAVTSSTPQSGWATDKYVYVLSSSGRQLRDTGWCKGGMIWGNKQEFEMLPHIINSETVYAANPSNPVEKFFVGSEDQYRRTVDPQGTIYSPCR